MHKRVYQGLPLGKQQMQLPMLYRTGLVTASGWLDSGLVNLSAPSDHSFLSLLPHSLHLSGRTWCLHELIFPLLVKTDFQKRWTCHLWNGGSCGSFAPWTQGLVQLELGSQKPKEFKLSSESSKISSNVDRDNKSLHPRGGYIEQLFFFFFFPLEIVIWEAL